MVENKGYILNLENYVNSSKILFKEIDKDLKNINNYHNKSLKSYEFIKNNLINVNCYSKFKKKFYIILLIKLLFLRKFSFVFPISFHCSDVDNNPTSLKEH